MTEAAIQPNKSKKAYVVMGLVALCLAYIVSKNVLIPPFLLVSLAILSGVVLLVAGVRNPQVVTYALVAYLPFSKVLAGDFGGLAFAFNFTNMLMLFIIVVWLTGKYSEGEPLWISSTLNVPIFIFMFLGLISIVRGVNFDSSYLHFAIIEYKRWITPIFLYFLVLNTVKERDMIKSIVIIMCIVTTIVGLMAIYDYINVGEGSLDRMRIGGICDQPNMLAAFFSYYMFLPFGFFLLNINRWKYWWLLAPFAICFRGIMVTFSRGGYLAFAFGLFMITFFRSKFMFLILIALTLFTLVNPILIPEGIRYRMGQTIRKSNTTYSDSIAGVKEADLEGSSRSRIEIWRAGLRMVQDHPVFGVGYGLFPAMLKYYQPGSNERDAHNTYLIIAAEMGIPTLVVFLWIILLVFLKTYKLYKTTHDPFTKAFALGFLGGLFGLLMSNMFGSRLDSQEVSSYFWILAALVTRLLILDAKEQVADQSPETKGHKPSRTIQKLDAVWRD